MKKKELNLIFKEGEGEKMGTGFERIRQICKKENAPFPEVEFNENYFYVNFRQSYEYLKLADKKEGLQKRWVEKWSEMGLSKNQISIIGLIEQNPNISRKELSQKLDINPSAIQKHIKKLKDLRVLKRIGPDKGGYWQIIKKPK